MDKETEKCYPEDCCQHEVSRSFQKSNYFQGDNIHVKKKCCFCGEVQTLIMDRLAQPKKEHGDKLPTIEPEESGNILTIEIAGVTDAQAISIEAFMAQWDSLGGIGASRWTCFFADGDGNFRPKIKINGLQPQHQTLIDPKSLWVNMQSQDKDGEYRGSGEAFMIDFDSIAWALTTEKEKMIKKTDFDRLIEKTNLISSHVNCNHHTEVEMFNFYRALESLSSEVEGCIVECGAFKGGSTAKFSLFAEEVGRELVVFDSFEGIPKNDEPHRQGLFDIWIGGPFKEGSFCGTLEEVKANVRRFGSQKDICEFHKGWFEDTMPHFRRNIAAIYLDVDLVSSTKTCLKYLYPLLQPGGIVFSQDAHIPLIVELFESDEFWNEELGVRKPKINGLRETKVINFTKEED